MNKKVILRFVFLLAALSVLWEPSGVLAQNTSALNIALSSSASFKVNLERAPDGGIQPQAVNDSKGIVHLIYYRGDAQAGDIYYVRQDGSGNLLSQPVRVNSQPNSAIAMGWVRGAQIAIGKDDSVHVLWNGSGKAAPKAIGETRPLLYTRLKADGTFEPQRNLITWAGGIDGGGAIAADRQGSVYVFWHAPEKEGADDAHSAVFLARSINNGANFAREEKVSPPATGACGCCGMKALIDDKGILYLLYRAAGENVNRDTMLLRSSDAGKTFESQTLAKWKLDACPLTMYSITEDQASGAVTGAWKNENGVYFAPLNTNHQPSASPISPSAANDANDGNRQYQVIIANGRGAKLFAWVEGAAWGRGGALAWQIFDRNNQPVGARGHAEGIPAWSLLTGFARADGTFTLIY